MNQEQDKTLSRIIAKCWADQDFKRKLLADPAGTLKSEGIEVPAGQSITVVENTDNVFHLVIPAQPAEMSDEDMDKVTGGFLGFFINGPAKPKPKVSGGGGGTLNGIAGESLDDKHHDD